MTTPDILTAFVESACVPIGPNSGGHQNGNLDKANELLQTHPDLPASSLYAAVILGDEQRTKEALAQEPAAVSAKGGPRNWDPLTYLCFSRYLRLDPQRSDGLLRTASLLLDAGADPNTGFFEGAHQPKPEWESVLYGAAGVAHHPGLTKLLLDRGGHPNDGEVPYHSPETYDNATLQILIDSGKLNAASLNTMLLRKSDWHDAEGTLLLLKAGADPNGMTVWGYTALHQALRRDNGAIQIRYLLDNGADPNIKSRREQMSAASIAIRRGRSDILDIMIQRKLLPEAEGAERLVLACAMNDEATIEQIKTTHPEWVEEVNQDGPTLLAEFAGTANTEGVARLLDLGIPVDSLYSGDGYYGIPWRSTALHVAAWKAWPNTVKLLIKRGASVDAKDGNGRTPLQLAIRAATVSYWTGRRSTDSIKALLDAHASIAGVTLPTGYPDADVLLAAAGAARH